MPGAQSRGEALAVYARQLAFEPYLQILRRHPQSLLLRLEPTRRHALENHVHRPPQLGLAVLINENWYNWSGATQNFAQGTILFSSGDNAGVSANIKSVFPGSGLVLSYPLYVNPTPGDAFTAY